MMCFSHTLLYTILYYWRDYTAECGFTSHRDYNEELRTDATLIGRKPGLTKTTGYDSLRLRPSVLLV